MALISKMAGDMNSCTLRAAGGVGSVARGRRREGSVHARTGHHHAEANVETAGARHAPAEKGRKKGSGLNTTKIRISI